MHRFGTYILGRKIKTFYNLSVINLSATKKIHFATKMMLPDGRVEIYEEPRKLGRFRYESEGRSAPLEGVRSTPTAKTFPSIKVLNYTGMARVVVSCVTADEPHRQHPNRLVGQHCRNGICYIDNFHTDSREPTILSFPGLCIQSCTKREVRARLQERARFNINPFDLSAYGADDLRRNIHEVRLCFQVIYNPDPQNPANRAQFTPVVSQPIINDRGALSDIKIDEISELFSPASGGKKIIIFCNKITKGDIEIRFFEEDATNKKQTLIGLGLFEPYDVYQDVAIAFKTPRFNLRSVDKPTNAFVQLVRPSDNARSNRIPFQYIPDFNNVDRVNMSKQEKIDKSKTLFEHLC